MTRLQSVVAARPGTPKVGRELFAQNCAKCHTLFGKGGVAGPELTTYPRQDTANLLLHIVDPNTAIREGYLTSIVTMVDGRTLAGVIADQDNQTVVLRGSGPSVPPLSSGFTSPSGNRTPSLTSVVKVAPSAEYSQ